MDEVGECSWTYFTPWSGEEVSWKTGAENVESDLNFLLGLNPHNFWAQIKGKRAGNFLDSLLTSLPRSSKELSLYPTECEPLLDRIYRRTLLVVLRLSEWDKKVFKRSQDYGSFVYDNFIMDVPRLWDVCSLFASSNHSLVSKITKEIMHSHPKYLTKDYPEAVLYLCGSLESLNEAENIEEVFSTLEAFLRVYPAGARLFYNYGFHLKAASVYSNCLITNAKPESRPARAAVIDTVHLVMDIRFVEPFTRSGVDFDEYLNVWSEFLSNEAFVVDYDSKYPMKKELLAFSEADVIRAEYLLSGISQKRQNILNAKSQKSESPEENSAVDMIRDTLPELGEEFVRKCLDYYDDDPIKVINAIFEENLPPHLESMDRQTIVPPQQEKKDKNAFLDDKSFMDDNVRARIQSYGVTADMVECDETLNDYDDEYDDTYDDCILGQQEPDAREDEREFVLPRALGGGHKPVKKVVPVESEEEDEEEASRNSNFCRNPAEIREEKERKRLSKGNNKSGKSPRDVVGNAKGQGQDKGVLRNRAFKNANKNKGHRMAADKKMSKGMF